VAYDAVAASETVVSDVSTAASMPAAHVHHHRDLGARLGDTPLCAWARGPPLSLT
jgi:hypothetical protein